MKLSEHDVINALKLIKHPGYDKDIVSLNIIKDIRIDAPANKINISLIFPRFNDPLKSSIKKACLKVLRQHLDDNPEINIEIISDFRVNTKETKRSLGDIKNVIAIASGKGGVGKSTVSVNLATAFAKSGHKVGLIDADIYGPSIPKMLNAGKEKIISRKVNGKDMIIPVEKYNMKILSMGFMTDPENATVWRGPMASKALRQLMSETDWGNLDYMFIDLPPGTSDIQLTIAETAAITGAVIISTPQDVAIADAVKGISMFRSSNINIPILGLIENMAWFTPEELPDKKYFIFGKDGCKKLTEQFNIPLLGQIPIIQSIREDGDNGTPSVLKNNMTGKIFEKIVYNLILQINKRDKKSEQIH